MPGWPQCLRVVWCPGGVCVVRGVGPYRRCCDEHFPCLGRRPGAPMWAPGWCAGVGRGGTGGAVQFLDEVLGMPVVVFDWYMACVLVIMQRQVPAG